MRSNAAAAMIRSATKPRIFMPQFCDRPDAMASLWTAGECRDAEVPPTFYRCGSPDGENETEFRGQLRFQTFAKELRKRSFADNCVPKQSLGRRRLGVARTASSEPREVSGQFPAVN